MRKNIKLLVAILAFIVFSSEALFSQVYMQFGYNAGFPRSLDNMNYIVDEYNRTRNYLDKQMGHFNYLDGFTTTMDVVFEPLFFEFGYTGGKQKRYAEGVDNTNKLVRRDVLIKERTFDIGGGLAVINDNKGAFFLGGTLNLGSSAIYTRTGSPNTIKKADYGDKLNDFSLLFTGTVFLRFLLSNPGIAIEPYYRFNIDKTFYNDISDVHQALNPNTAPVNPTPLDLKYNTFGVKCSFGLAFE